VKSPAGSSRRIKASGCEHATLRCARLSCVRSARLYRDAVGRTFRPMTAAIVTAMPPIRIVRLSCVRSARLYRDALGRTFRPVSDAIVTAMPPIRIVRLSCVRPHGQALLRRLRADVSSHDRCHRDRDAAHKDHHAAENEHVARLAAHLGGSINGANGIQQAAHRRTYPDHRVMHRVAPPNRGAIWFRVRLPPTRLIGRYVGERATGGTAHRIGRWSGDPFSSCHERFGGALARQAIDRDLV
jgi:hypothetical protein